MHPRRRLEDDVAMGRLLPLLFLADVALLVVALIDCLSSDEYEIRALPKVVWVFIILLFSPVGPIVWFVAGRPARVPQPRADVWQSGNGFPESSRPRRGTAPDDDPEFLRGLATSRREDEELLRRWEADLRRREEELRKKEHPHDGEPPDA
jgi:Phospholipase_D-nuclease N-terminal